MNKTSILKEQLQEIGIDVSDWTDTQLATATMIARAVREGEKIFLPKAMLPLIESLSQEKVSVSSKNY